MSDGRYVVKKDIWSKPIKNGIAGENDLVHSPPKGGRYPSVKHRGRVERGESAGPCLYTEDAFDYIED